MVLNFLSSIHVTRVVCLKFSEARIEHENLLGAYHGNFAKVFQDLCALTIGKPLSRSTYLPGASVDLFARTSLLDCLNLDSQPF